MISPFLKYKALKNSADKPNARAQHFLWRTAKITAGNFAENDVEIEWIMPWIFPKKVTSGSAQAANGAAAS
jgi:hypothetical protein